MADQVPNHFTTEFSKNWIERVQQTKCRLDAYIEFDDFDGERKRYDRIGSMSSQEIVDRKGETRTTDANTDSRWAYRVGYDVANTLDEDDSKNLGPLTLPDSDYVRQHTNAYHRDCDDVSWGAAFNSVKTGTLGTTDTPLPSGQIIVHGGTGLTIAKLITANEIIEDADLEDEAPRVLCVTAKQLTNLLNTTEVRSADYNTVKALVAGQIDTFMGFKFIKIKRLPKASTTRSCIGWVKGAIKVMRGTKTVHMDWLPKQQHSLQIRSKWNLGGVRVHDESVVVIECTES